LTLNTVAHGTLPHYREESESIELDEAVLELRLRLRDNYLWIELRKEDYKEAEGIVLGAVDRFIQLLAVNRGTYFSAEFLQAIAGTGASRSIARQPRRVSLGRIKTYDLPAFRESLRWAFGAVSLASDGRLAKALDYFNHAQFLSRMREGLPLGYVRVQSYMAADIFSNYYRAASAIVGDPKKDKDYQSRYKKIGLSDEDWKNIERVRQLRNDYGVAHYDLGDRIKELEQELGMAVQATKKIINYYIASLRSKKVSELGENKGCQLE
jgi:tetratricopeptide (TPR) repeat protein